MKKIPQMLSIAVVCIGLASCQEAQVDQAALDLKVQERSAVLIEKANGKAITTNNMSILDIEPSSLHQRVPVYLGSSELVNYFSTIK